MTRYLEEKPPVQFPGLVYSTNEWADAERWYWRFQEEFGGCFSFRRFGPQELWGVFHDNEREAINVREWMWKYIRDQRSWDRSP